MKIVFKTAIDKYKTNCFPTNLTHVPRIGEKVMVTEVFIKYYENKNLPITLKVFDVIHTERGIIVELHYSEIDIKCAQASGVNLF